jgi:hypothetical protein
LYLIVEFQFAHFQSEDDRGNVQRQENTEFDTREFKLCQHVRNHSSNTLIWISETFIVKFLVDAFLLRPLKHTSLRLRFVLRYRLLIIS